MIEPRYNIWLELDGEVVLSVWRVRLLNLIRDTGSISAAAKAMEVPYRRAWERLQEIEGRLGFPLVETEVGGEGGGGARLTPRAEELVDRFQRFVNGLDDEITDRFEHSFGTSPETLIDPGSSVQASKNQASSKESP